MEAATNTATVIDIEPEGTWVVPVSLGRRWAEFAWRVAEGKYKLETTLKSVEIPMWQDHFANGQNVQDLLTLGRPWLRPHIGEVAFGSLLHVVQDSFAKGHVTRREPVAGTRCAAGIAPAFGAILEFHSYANQDHQRHKDADSVEAWLRRIVREITFRASSGNRVPTKIVRPLRLASSEEQAPPPAAAPAPPAGTQAIRST